MKKLSKFNCFVGTMNGKLHLCRLVNEWPEFIAGQVNWVEVKSPVTTEFLDAANSILGTNYRLDDFSDGQDLKLDQKRKNASPPANRGESHPNN